MSVIVKDKVFELADEGVHSVVVSEIQDKGLVETQYGVKDKVCIIFEVLDQKDTEGNPIKLFVTANKALGNKSTLGNLLNDLGVPVNGDVDLDDLIGIQTQAVVKHNTGTNGKTYANIVSFLKKKA